MITGFAIQKNRHYKEEITIIHHCIMNKIPYKFCNKSQDIPEGFIPIGSVEWIDKLLLKEKTIPDYYPDFLKDYLFRNVWKTDKWPIEKGIFIKPADKHKRFNGFVTFGGYKKKKKPPYWCSDVVHFINEWRYYIANGEVLAGEWYSGDEINTPDAPKLNIEIPKNYCGALDFGTLSTGKLALVEANSPYACGWYGKNYDLYVKWITAGWNYLMKGSI